MAATCGIRRMLFPILLTVEHAANVKATTHVGARLD